MNHQSPARLTEPQRHYYISSATLASPPQHLHGDRTMHNKKTRATNGVND